MWWLQLWNLRKDSLLGHKRNASIETIHQESCPPKSPLYQEKEMVYLWAMWKSIYKLPESEKTQGSLHYILSWLRYICFVPGNFQTASSRYILIGFLFNVSSTFSSSFSFYDFWKQPLKWKLFHFSNTKGIRVFC